MRIFRSLALILIVGISSSSIAQEYYGSWFSAQLRDKCERNGGPTAYENYNYTASVENLSNCFGNLVNLPRLEAELTAANERSDNLETIYQQYRIRIPALAACLQRSIDYVDSCLDPVERQSLYILSSAAETSLQYVTQNGDVVGRFFRHGGKQCVTSNYESLRSCASRSFRSFSSGQTGINIPGLGDLPNLSVNLEGCREIQTYQNCIVHVLEACDDPSTAQIVDYLFNLFKTDANCATQIEIDENRRNQRRNGGTVGYLLNSRAYDRPSEFALQSSDPSERWYRHSQAQRREQRFY